MAMGAVIIRAWHPDFADGAQEGFGLPALELGVFAARGAVDAGPLVPPFFRSERAVSRAMAAISRVRSRNWNSVAPNSWLSAFEANKRAISRRSFSVLRRRIS